MVGDRLYSCSEISLKSQTPCFPHSHSAARDAKPLRLSDGRFNVGLGEVVAFEKQRLGKFLCKRICETVSEVESGGMSAALAIDAKCLKRGSGMLFGYGCDGKPQNNNEFLEQFLARSRSIAAKDHPCFQKTGSRDPANGRVLDGPQECGSFRLSQYNREQRGGIDHHLVAG